MHPMVTSQLFTQICPCFVTGTFRQFKACSGYEINEGFIEDAFTKGLEKVFALVASYLKAFNFF